jgi:flagellar biosynthesis GTPase FlhF
LIALIQHKRAKPFSSLQFKQTHGFEYVVMDHATPGHITSPSGVNFPPTPENKIKTRTLWSNVRQEKQFTSDKAMVGQEKLELQRERERFEKQQREHQMEQEIKEKETQERERQQQIREIKEQETQERKRKQEITERETNRSEEIKAQETLIRGAVLNGTSCISATHVGTGEHITSEITRQFRNIRPDFRTLGSWTSSSGCDP